MSCTYGIDIKDRTNQKWTKKEDAIAIALYKTGDYTFKQIAERLGRSKESTRKRLSRLDVWGSGKYIGA